MPYPERSAGIHRGLERSLQATFHTQQAFIRALSTRRIMINFSAHIYM